MGLVSRSCINAECGTTAAEEWRKGWALRSGGHANLCGSCGMAYEQSIFCDLFHAKESGWRECSCCGKRLHCGCVASRSLIVLVDDGGVRCLNCAKNSDLSPAQGEIFLDSLLQLPEKSLVMSGRAAGDDKVDNVVSSTAGRSNMPLVHRDNMNGSFKHVKREEIMLSVADLGLSSFPSVNHGANSSSQPSNEKRGFNSISPGCLGISIGASLNQSHAADPINFQRDSHLSLSTSDLGAERWEQVHQGQQAHPRPLKSTLLPSLEPPKEMPVVSHLRIARPPGEGKGRNHLLPRYWPRITDQELKQISGDSNSTIVPLFEKVLSASDAGRIGRLVLPKACAEAYFPPISQPEGLPLRIQDAKGNDWIFQFRFWPNNNSRMYVLEGVTPCIQAMQLQAGDTVTFSRIDPEGKLVMGFRKATNSVPLQDSQISAIANGNESFLSGVIENLQYPFLSSEKRRSRNISSKRKRLHIDREDALELKLTWEEAQDLLRAPPNSTPSIVVIENYEFEEYEEPPVLAKRTIFTSGEGVRANDQWVQCDDCYKWRRVPADAVVLSKWACADNVWDQKRSSCSDPDEMGEKELQDLLLLNEDFKKRKLSQSSTHPAAEPADLETLASLAVMNYDATPAALSDAAAATTRHPRHRPGCSCIVCIQPPSGKGPKHKPTCPCNVCLTVRRRFKTLMLRKKKRQSEQQAQLAHLTLDQSAPGSSSLSLEPAQIDLNSRPERGSMMSLLQVASFPLEKYLKEKGLSSLAQDRHGSSSSSSSSHAAAPPAVTGSGDGSPERDSGGE